MAYLPPRKPKRLRNETTEQLKARLDAFERDLIPVRVKAETETPKTKTPKTETPKTETL